MKTSFLILFLTIASFLLGFLRDILIASNFGSGWLSDLLFLALVLPVFLENLLGLALRDGMIPYLKRFRHEAPSVYPNVVLSLYRFGMVLGGGTTLVVVFGARWMLPLLAPGWSATQVSAGLLAFVVGSSLIAVQTTLYCQAAFLNVENKFILPMWRPILLNIGAIVVLMFSVNKVEFVLIGMCVSQILLVIIQHINLKDVIEKKCLLLKEIINEREIFGSISVVMVATAAQQVCVIAERLFASFLQEGSITMLSLAFRITTIPLTIFSLSFLTVIYPSFSDMKFQSNEDDFSAFLRKGAKLTLACLIPATALLAAQSELVVKVLLERGAFGIAQTKNTAPLVFSYAVGLPGFGLALLWGRVLVARQRARLFLAAAVVGMIFTVMFDFFVYRNWGSAGLALSFSLGGWLQALISGVFVERETPGSLDIIGLFRWFFVGFISLLFLGSFSLFNGLFGLFCACFVAIIITFGLLLVMGEREIFQYSFWKLRPTGY